MASYKKIVEFSAFHFNPEVLTGKTNNEIKQLVEQAFNHAVEVHSVKMKRNQLRITMSPMIGKVEYELEAGEWLVEQDDFQYCMILSEEEFAEMTKQS